MTGLRSNGSLTADHIMTKPRSFANTMKARMCVNMSQKMMMIHRFVIFVKANIIARLAMGPVSSTYDSIQNSVV